MAYTWTGPRKEGGTFSPLFRLPVLRLVRVLPEPGRDEHEIVVHFVPQENLAELLTPKGLHPTAQGRGSAPWDRSVPFSFYPEGVASARRRRRCNPFRVGTARGVRFPRVRCRDPGLRDVTPIGVNHGGDTGRSSSYSDSSAFCPRRAGMSTRSSFISFRRKILRNFVMKAPASRWPES
jgi:hypothetical protein